ncbi:NADH-quinone oxidoreductase subunit C [Euzebya sp.]|uniref:NADH-quinone oxidoreductase subunit C n=1 Tax=Euzebya sp. TaxID=1971409 RepID=UPI003511305D
MTGSETTGQSEGLSGAYTEGREDTAGASGLSLQLQELREVLTDALPGTRATEHRGELTLEVAPEALLDVLTFCRDDERVSCELLSDLSAVHWPGGLIRENLQETTGWPEFTEEVAEGRFDVNYVLRSATLHHWFRVRVRVPDAEGSSLPSAAGLWSSAVFMEREVYDMAGIIFDDHPGLTRIHMPEDWVGHPHRKDYPLGGVEVMYKGKTIPPPDERTY